MAQRLVLMMSLFQSCSDWADGFQTGEISRELQNDSFVDKFQRMASAWHVQFLSGATCFCLARLCLHLDGGRPDCDSLDDLMRPDGTCELSSVAAQWRKRELTELARQRREVDQCLVQLLQQQLAAHSWLHDTNNGGLGSTCGLFILNLRQSLSVLLSQSPQLTEIHQQMASLATQVEQRLKWAAGANSSLLKVIFLFFFQFLLLILKICHQVMKEFSRRESDCLQRLQKLSSLATGLGSVSSAILHYETFRTKTQESLAADSMFIQVRN